MTPWCKTGKVEGSFYCGLKQTVLLLHLDSSPPMGYPPSMTGMMPDAGMLRQLDGATRPPPIGSERAKRHLGGPPFMGANLGMSDRMMMAGPGGDGVDRGWGVIGMAGRHPGSAQQRDIQDWLHCSTNGTGGPSVTPEFAENISNLEQISNQLVQVSIIQVMRLLWYENLTSK
jgi:hypothetical protein